MDGCLKGKSIAVLLHQAYAQSNESTASLANAEKIVAEYKQKTAELSSKVEEMSRWKASIVTAVKEVFTKHEWQNCRFRLQPTVFIPSDSKSRPLRIGRSGQAKTESELKERELAAARAFVDQLQEQVKQQALENRRRSRSSSGSSSGSNGSNENNEPVMAQRAQEKMKRLQLTHEAELHDMKASLQKLQEKFTLEKQRGDKLLAENAKLIGAMPNQHCLGLKSMLLEIEPRLGEPLLTPSRLLFLTRSQ